MAPGTHTGAAHPVLLAGTPDETLNRKISNDAAASLRTVTERRGRNPAVAEKAVLESKSFTDQEALKEKLIDLIAANDQELMQQLDGRTVRRFDGRTTTLLLKDAVLTPYELTTRERLQSALLRSEPGTGHDRFRRARPLPGVQLPWPDPSGRGRRHPIGAGLGVPSPCCL